MAKRILITGATGLIGGALVRELVSRGDDVRALVRHPLAAREKLPREVEIREWVGDGALLSANFLATQLLGGFDSVVHRVGEPVARCRWSEQRKKRLVDSRVRSIRGPVNAVAPGAVSNREFSRTLAHALGRPAILHAPGFALKLALGERAGILLEGQRVRPGKLERAGFTFRYRELSAALEDLLGSTVRNLSKPSASA